MSYCYGESKVYQKFNLKLIRSSYYWYQKYTFMIPKGYYGTLQAAFIFLGDSQYISGVRVQIRNKMFGGHASKTILMHAYIFLLRTWQQMQLEVWYQYPNYICLVMCVSTSRQTATLFWLRFKFVNLVTGSILLSL